ncbi:hypothetical protein AKJ43_00275 [candidate division MSBL1 archaeon SCGC-AAA261D19]|uniref:DUF5615 domain-containing protein n=1 Tax=candidate division MSBL1 archaeon SCGC-AAA261D19 TaxID=1698273 RepID=A0A133V8T3_9EURY|nr:hypothetical protein AKJ43_00275 [candidate division MSBL1 archaeon SCGC-AAA261D19]
MSAKLLLDEMYTGFKEYFEILGWEVTTVHEEGLSGAEDKEIVKYAKKNNLLIVTQDQKPAELAELMEIPNVLISKRAIAELIDSEIRKKYQEE